MSVDTGQKLIILTAPSGSGKTTLVQHLLRVMPHRLDFSISACTRAPRQGEEHGRHYYFIPLEEFTRKIANHEFAEFEMVYEGKYYGTLKAELERIWAAKKTPIVDIDVQGALRLKRHYHTKALTIFVQAPSMQVLETRLRARGTETEATIKERINKASQELEFAPQFDKIILNHDLPTACNEVQNIVESFLNQPS